MAERLKRAAAWLGLVTDDRYPEYADSDYDDNENTESVSREELIDRSEESSGYARPNGHQGDQQNGYEGHQAQGASVTTLETRRPAQPSVQPTTQPTTPAQSQRADMSKIITVHPRTYNEARTIGEHFRDGVPVIMNLSEMDDSDAKRLVDFAAGLIFGLRGTIERVTSKVFLLSPQNVSVAAEDKQRIAGGFFNQS